MQKSLRSIGLFSEHQNRARTEAARNASCHRIAAPTSFDDHVAFGER